jgi:hypothetical protein
MYFVFFQSNCIIYFASGQHIYFTEIPGTERSCQVIISHILKDSKTLLQFGIQ